MQNFQTETVIEKDGKLHLEHLPFAEGVPVQVLVSPKQSTPTFPLKGTVVKYETPFAPVADQDWDASK